MLTSYDSTYDVYPETNGLIRYADNAKIENSYNNGNLHHAVDKALAHGTIVNCYDSGIRRGRISYIKGENAYTYILSQPEILHWSESYDSVKTESELRNQETFVGWEFDTTWRMNEQRNSGYPTLVCDANPLQLNYSNKIMCEGETLQLIAYKNNQKMSSEFENVPNF